ncbi:putative leader peptide [Streptomyces sp. SID9124]
MVPHDVSDKTPGSLLVARLHVDLCRLSSAICTNHRPTAGREA